MTPTVSKTQAAAILQAAIAVAVVLGVHPGQQTQDLILGLAGVVAVALSWADTRLRHTHLKVELGHRVLDSLSAAADVLGYLHDELAAAAHDGSPAGDVIESMLQRIETSAAADQATQAANGTVPDPGAEPGKLTAPPAPATHGPTF